MPIQLAADRAPKGRATPASAPTPGWRRGGRRWRPVPRAWRRSTPTPCGSTGRGGRARRRRPWRRRRSDPPGPGRSMPPLIQVGWMRSASSIAVTAFGHTQAASARIGREAVDVLEREPGVGDRLEAGVDRQRQGVDHEAPAEARPADAAEDGPMLEALVPERRARGRAAPARAPGRPGRSPPSARRAAARRPRGARSGRPPPGRCARRPGRSRRCWSSGARGDPRPGRRWR